MIDKTNYNAGFTLAENLVNLPEDLVEHIIKFCFDWEKKHKVDMGPSLENINSLFNEAYLYHTNRFGDICNLNDRFHSLWARNNLSITTIGWNLKGQNKWWYGFGWKLRYNVK